MLVLAEQNRTFGYAVAASIALHALILAAHFPAKRVMVVSPPEPPLVAHLAEPAPPPAAAPARKEPPAVKEPPQPPKAARPRPAAQPKPAPAPRPSSPIAAAEPAVQPMTEAPRETEPEPLEQEAAPAAPPAPAPSVAVVAPQAAAPAADPAAALARFRQQLVDLAVRYKRYPRMALDNGWTGDVVVRIDVAASGAVAAVNVRTSSGFDVLDEQALEMFRKAAPEVQVPAALRGKPFSVEVRAIYNLQDRPG